MNDDSTAPAAPSRLSPRVALLVSIVGIAAVVVIAVALIFAFRDSDSKPSSDLERYFDDAGPVLSTVSQRAAEGDDTSTGPLLGHLSTVLRDISETLDTISAPDEVGDAHSALIEALEEEAVVLGDLATEDLGAATAGELAAVLGENDELRVIAGRVTQSCSELQSVADENEIEVELELC